ncbi:flavin reductase [Pimelobacter simplex]|uniref:Flavin reductase n=1 Tax=Nocardioides simplex TaxID=2045 RepID=A0A7J5E2X9_NOCSI|nr:flavin reductase [Pimelobacter simplex]KAB2812635.1 flavin reductase [Pimelobacter simplex]
MSDTELAGDGRRFREVLAHFPTGVVVVTALGADDVPLGMVVGSFTSVSLDPPLVAYLPAKSSSSYAALRERPRFCVNVLASDQEQLCRQFASRGTDKFAGVSWDLSPGGSPVLDGAVAWLDCTVESVLDGGDHDIVLGRVEHLDVPGVGAGDPLLFFQGGYGGFRPRSLVAPWSADLRLPLQVADVARGPMDELAREVGFPCYAQALVDDEVVVVAGAGGDHGMRTHIGRRMPLVPPYGSLFLDLADAEVATTQWAHHLRSAVAPEVRAGHREMLERVRERGWSLGLRAPQHDDVWEEVARFSEARVTPDAERRIGALLDGLTPYYEPADLDPAAPYDVRMLAAPVRRDGRTVLVLVLYGMPGGVPGAQVDGWRERLVATADAVSARLAELG